MQSAHDFAGSRGTENDADLINMSETFQKMGCFVPVKKTILIFHLDFSNGINV